MYSAREPQTYKTWYGKTWLPCECSYWKPTPAIPYDPNKRFHVEPNLTTYQYGGTGMSIIDASIFLKPELFQLEEKYLFVEDMWLSYIVQLSGWKIHRLFISFMNNQRINNISLSGQYRGLANTKDEFFETLGYLQCWKKQQ